MNAPQQRRRHRRRSFPRSRTTPLEGGFAGSFGHGGTARMVRGATACTTRSSAAAPLGSVAGTVGTGTRTNDGHPLGFGNGLGDEHGNHHHHHHHRQQPKRQDQSQQQPAWGEQQQQPQEVQAHTGNKNGDAGEPTAEWEAMVLERVSRMGLGDDDNNNHTDGNGESSGVPSPAATSASTSTSASISTSISTSSTASVEDSVQVTTAAPPARPPARRFRVRADGTASTSTTNQSITGIDGTSMHQSRESNNNKTNKRGATDLTATPVTNNQTTRPGDQTPPPTTVDTACSVGAHPLLLLGNAGSASTSGLLPRLSPPLGLQSPTTTNTNPNTNVNTNDKCQYIHATASSASSSPTSTTATPTVTAQMLSCSITTCTQQQLSADGTSVAIDGGPNGGPRKRRMLKKRHRRSNASLISGASIGYGAMNGGMSNGGGTNDGSVAGDVGCLGGILPDLAGIFDGACGGGADDAVADGDGTASTGNAYANGIGGRSSPHSLAAGGCGSSSSSSSSCSFPDPFGLVTKARRSRNGSPRPSSTTLGSGGTSSQDSGSSRLARPNFSAVPHPLARPKRPSAPTPPGGSMTTQSSSVFDRRLDRLASGVPMPSSKGTSTTAGDNNSGSGMPAPPNLVPKFRASPLPFSANLHVTPQPRRATASRHHTHHGKSIAACGGGRNGTAGRQVRGGAKPGSHMGATLSASTGFAGSATFAAPSFSRGSTPVPPPGNGGTIPAPPPTPVDTML